MIGTAQELTSFRAIVETKVTLPQRLFQGIQLNEVLEHNRNHEPPVSCVVLVIQPSEYMN